MKVRIRARHLGDISRLRAHVLRRLEAALGRRRDRVQHATVRIEDENGPRGGADKRCRIQVLIPGVGEVFVAERHTDTFAAIDLAARRAARAVARTLARARRLAPPAPLAPAS